MAIPRKDGESLENTEAPGKCVSQIFEVDVFTMVEESDGSFTPLLIGTKEVVGCQHKIVGLTLTRPVLGTCQQILVIDYNIPGANDYHPVKLTA